MIKIDWKLFRVPAVVFSTLLTVSAVVLSQVTTQEIVISIVASGLLCFFHLIVGYVVLESAFEGTPTSFLKRVLGGMVIRLTVMLLIFAGLLMTERVDETWLLLGLLMWYALALVFEITALQKKVSLRQHTQ